MSYGERTGKSPEAPDEQDTQEIRVFEVISATAGLHPNEKLRKAFQAGNTALAGAMMEGAEPTSPVIEEWAAAIEGLETELARRVLTR